MACTVQASYLRQLNQRGEPEAVIRQYEGGRVISSEATLGEYVKALVKVDRLDSSALVQTLQVLSPALTYQQLHVPFPLLMYHVCWFTLLYKVRTCMVALLGSSPNF